MTHQIKCRIGIILICVIALNNVAVELITIYLFDRSQVYKLYVKMGITVTDLLWKKSLRKIALWSPKLFLLNKKQYLSRFHLYSVLASDCACAVINVQRDDTGESVATSSPGWLNLTEKTWPTCKRMSDIYLSSHRWALFYRIKHFAASLPPHYARLFH